MITTTATVLIRAALLDLGAIAAGQALPADEGADHLAALNRLIDALPLEQDLLYSLVRTLKTLAASTASYTIGSAGSIAIARPERILRAGLILDTAADPTTEIPLDVLDDDQYAAWPLKTDESSRPLAVFYNRGFDADGYGTIYPLPIPSVGTTQLVLYTRGGHVSQFANLTTEYELKDGFGRFLQKNLSLEIAPGYPQCVVSQELRNQASHSRRALKLSHARRITRANSPILTGHGGFFDIDSGTFR